MKLEKNWKNTLKLIGLTILGVIIPIMIASLVIGAIVLVNVFFHMNFGEEQRKTILTLLILTPFLFFLVYASYDFALTSLIVKQKKAQDLDKEKKK